VDGPGYVIFDDIHFENIGQRGHDMTNQGFEEWTDLGIDFPQHWRSLDLLYYDTYLTFLSERSAFRSSDALLGNSSLKITNYDSANPRRTYIYIGTENDDYYTPCFKIYQKYAYFQGCYKMESDAEDSAFIQFRTFENGQLLSNSFMYLTPTTKWTHFSFPINYYRDSIPDSAALIAYSGVGTIKSAQTALYLDGLDLVMQPYSVGISDVDSRFRMYPNPVESEIHILLQEPMYCVILDVQGREVLRMELLAGRNSIDLSSQPTGIYYIRLVNDNYQWQKIVVKQ
jgi:hypothetical protein